MVEKIVNKIIEKQLEENLILQEDVCIYQYGYTLVCEVVINIIIAVLIGIISEDLIAVLFFLVIYIPLRSFCGGWHADKIWKCTIFSNLILFIMVLLEKYCIYIFKMHSFIIVFVVCVWLICWLSPIDTKSKPISIEEKKIYKKKINIILIIHIILMITIIILKLNRFVFIFIFSYITQVIMLILEMINKK